MFVYTYSRFLLKNDFFKPNNSARIIVWLVIHLIFLYSLYYAITIQFESLVLDSSFSLQMFVFQDEGGFVFDQEYNFNHEEHTVTTQKGDTVAIPMGIQDLVSAYYFARSIDIDSYKVGDILTFQAFVDGVVEPVRIKYIGKETIEIKSGKYRCFKFQPMVQKGRVFNEQEDLTVYISDDKNKVPVLIEAKVIVGSVKLELMTAKRLSHPLAKLN